MERPTSLPLTPDPLASPPMSPPPFQPKHVLTLLKEHNSSPRFLESIRFAAMQELNVSYGISQPQELVPQRAKKSRKSPRGRPGAATPTDTSGLKRKTEGKLEDGTELEIPFIVAETCAFIEERIDQQGIFRISGVASRAQGIMGRFANALMQDFFVVCDTVHDVAIVLKQYLRELESPLIPGNLHSLMLQCLELEEPNRVPALLLSACLIPPESLGTLCYILQFLKKVAAQSETNLMTVENLSIIMGLNIMPVLDQRKDNQRQLLNQHNKVVQLLISSASQVGLLTPELEQRIEHYQGLKSSEDELESEGHGRRKKRRSGSLNRMLDFIKKVATGRTADTPITPMPCTPGSFNYTPIIKGSSKTSTKKRKIFDGIGKSFNNTSTPVLPNQVVCPSPGVCLEPSPMKLEWKQTPLTNTSTAGSRLRNLVTPALLRKREKSDVQLSGPSNKASTSKPRIRFGKSKTNKKLDSPKKEIVARSRQNSVSTAVSIQNLANSPKTLSYSRIPKPAVPPKSKSLTSRSRQSSQVSLRGGGDYVAIKPDAMLDCPDIRNDAFLATSVTEPVVAVADTDLDSVQLSPLINEIERLTKTAGDLTLSTLRGKSSSSIHSTMSATLPDSPTEFNNTPLNTSQVEQKFIKVMRDTKVMELKREQEERTNPIVRRLSVQDRKRSSMSPSQRRISARRRSHEVGRVTPIVTPTRFLSLRSPRNSPNPAALKRSPNRCTLKRGRPNTARSGLAKPSPAVTPRASSLPCRTKKGNSESEQMDEELGEDVPPPLPPKPEKPENQETPIRRNSSVQALVKQLEQKKKQPPPAVPAEPAPSSSKVSESVVSETETPVVVLRRKKPVFKTPLSLPPEEGEQWTSAHQFNFSRSHFSHIHRSGERDSIHYLKTLGKVPATVEYFNKIGHKSSPGKSLIPRYTALHQKQTPEKNAEDSPRMITRRMSAIDIKKEQLLEQIKKESAAVKRSNTVTVTNGTKRTLRPIERPTTFRARPRSVILEEDDSFGAQVNKAVNKILLQPSPPASSSRKASPLKTSNLANSNSLKRSKPVSSPRKRTTLGRTASEAGTKSTTAAVVTPKIKKSLTTREYDVRTRSTGKKTPVLSTNTQKTFATAAVKVDPQPTPQDKKDFPCSAHKCQTITPRRRVPRMGNGTPRRTPLKATHAFKL